MVEFDFERVWLDKFSNCLEDIAGERLARRRGM